MHVANQNMQIVTGRNMGGRSTYRRQIAVIVLLASMGSYVSATACRLGPRLVPQVSGSL